MTTIPTSVNVTTINHTPTPNGRHRRRRCPHVVVGGILIIVTIIILSLYYEVNVFQIYKYDDIFTTNANTNTNDSSNNNIDSVDKISPWTEEPSRIEMIQNEFMVLKHVCLTNGEDHQSGPYMVHFFVDDADKLNKFVDLFQNNIVPYSAWESDAPHGQPLEGTPTVTSYWTRNYTMQQLILDRHYPHNISMDIITSTIVDGTTLIAEPHHPDNNFHLHNDFILPVLYRILKSQSNNLSPQHSRTLLITHGNQPRYKNRVVAFDVLYQLFGNVRYSLEQILQEPSHNGIMCFERVIMGGRSKLPYYSHMGRFGVDDRWKGVVPAIRDWVNTVHGIDDNVTRRLPSNHVDEAIAIINNAKPQLTFVDRPCQETSSRCLRNAPDLIRYLSQRFDVSLLSFPREQGRSEQLMNMLQRMARTDILVGMHGAGLGHTVYLQPGTLLVEIKDYSNREKKLFLNMASLQDIGYYLYDAIPASRQSPNTVLSDEEMEKFTEDLWRVWEQEQEYLLVRNSSDPILKGECLFPEYLETSQSKLSSFDLSRCYLEKAGAHSNLWWQCTHYRECSNGRRQLLVESSWQ
jgi:hypothetical protein